ncbi:hypothetical protein SAMN05421809_2428 [Natronorubrum daqingense]|uniref:Uncharacterized protein n=1 Tax=Natronorubrum daqingense TaxID=588898 RepID=A0A1N7E3B9_9EURY|nr:hypothetical protein BB347_06715 [Natronorubrum daqingense]SIR82544.1 hypothetical protein SAMN05421809_2428 [Natronorubrum daqingense]
MERASLLLLTLVTTGVGTLIVGWLGLLATNQNPWLPDAIEFLVIGILSLVVLLLWMQRSEDLI